MQEKADQFALSHDIGKIPRKISSCFDGFDLDKYRIWILLFHTYVLDDVISKRDKDCFGKFVLAWQYICKSIILRNDITIDHGLLIHFCKNAEVLYGKEKVTPNIYFHEHLKDCLLDNGPITVEFWETYQTTKRILRHK